MEERPADVQPRSEPSPLTPDEEIRPPIATTGPLGWIRTNLGESALTNDIRAGCSGWTSSDPSHFGSTVSLQPASAPPFGFDVRNCDEMNRVWCVEE